MHIKLLTRSALLATAATFATLTAAWAAPVVSSATIVSNGTLPAGVITFATPGNGGPFNTGPFAPPIDVVTGVVTANYTDRSGVYSGDVASVTRSPFRDAGGAALSNTGYFNARAGSGTIEFLLDDTNTIFNSFRLVWGSVDPTPATYNVLEFFNGATSLGTVNGGQVAAAVVGEIPGTTNVDVTITGITGFNRVIARASEEAFEFALFAPGGNPREVVPTPAALALFGVGLLGLGMAQRRRKDSAAAA